MNKLVLFVILTAVISINISCGTFLFDFGGCENTAVKEVISPDGKHKAVIFDRGCGATVGFITGITIISADTKLQNEDIEYILIAENVYREFKYKNGKTEYGKYNFDVEWISDEKLKVFYTNSKILSKKERLGHFKIEFQELFK